MHVSVTGATEFTGSAIIRELPNAGHQVPRLALPDEAVPPLAAARVGAHRGTADESGAPAGIAGGLG